MFYPVQIFTGYALNVAQSITYIHYPLVRIMSG